MKTPPPEGLSSSAFAALLQRGGFDPATARRLGGSQNFVYEAMHEGVSAIARVSVGRYRTRAEVAAELQWVEALHQRGVAVSPPLKMRGAPVCKEVVSEGQTYVLAGFARVPGRTPGREELTESFCTRAGVLFGQMHAAAVEATAAGRRVGRPDWRESRLLTHDLAVTTAPEPEGLRAAVQRLVREIATMPVGPETFGLIHGDVNGGNCHLDGGRLWLFDFDNCDYGYFLQDLAVMLYDTLYSKVVNHTAPDRLTATVKRSWDALLAGYRTTGPALAIGADELRRCFLLREAIIYGHLHRLTPAAQLASDPYVAAMRRNIEHGTHPLDFARLVAPA